MSDSKKRDEIHRIVEALDDVPLGEGGDAAKRLGIDVKKWAGAIRDRIAVADRDDRARRFEAAQRAFSEDVARYDARSSEPRRSIEENRRIMRDLVARVPRESGTATVHFHKFEEATEDELAEMIKALRHLLGEDE